MTLGLVKFMWSGSVKALISTIILVIVRLKKYAMVKIHKELQYSMFYLLVNKCYKNNGLCIFV